MPVRDTSALAYDQVRESGRATTQHGLIHRLVALHGPLTRRQISVMTGIETSTVSARVNKLIEIGLLAELPASKCPITGINVHPVTAEVAIHRCKNCHALIYRPAAEVPPVLGYLCSDQCERENTEHYS